MTHEESVFSMKTEWLSRDTVECDNGHDLGGRSQTWRGCVGGVEVTANGAKTGEDAMTAYDLLESGGSQSSTD